MPMWARTEAGVDLDGMGELVDGRIAIAACRGGLAREHEVLGLDVHRAGVARAVGPARLAATTGEQGAHEREGNRKR